MHKLHSFLVTAYLVGGLTLMATTPWADLTAALSHGGATLAVETLHGAAADESAMLADEAIARTKSAAASRQLMFGILLLTLGGFMHVYERTRSERPVHISIKKKKPTLLYWLEMKVSASST